MTEVKISINIVDSHDPHGIHFQLILDEFKQQNHVPVLLQTYTWGVVWNEFMKISKYGVGPVISQAGDSWMGSLIGQNSLRAFKDKELAQLNERESFLDASWQSCMNFNNKNVVAIPWILDTYLVYYHRDMLEKAGIDEAIAFSTLENFHATLQKLQASGVSYPLSTATAWSHSNIQILASWVWGNGGDFTNSEGTRVLFSKPETRKGVKMYFDLFRYISPERQPLTDQDALDLFLDRKVAVTIRNPTLLFRLKKQEFPTSFSENIVTAVIPGIPWIGGSHFIVWNHIRRDQERDALNLIKFLTSAYAGLAAFENIGLLPANLDALNEIRPDSIFAQAVQSVKKGRTFPPLRLWMVIEEKLAMAMMHIWSGLFATSNPDLDHLIAKNLDTLEDKLNTMLSQ